MAAAPARRLQATPCPFLQVDRRKELWLLSRLWTPTKQEAVRAVPFVPSPATIKLRTRVQAAALPEYTVAPHQLQLPRRHQVLNLQAAPCQLLVRISIPRLSWAWTSAPLPPLTHRPPPTPLFPPTKCAASALVHKPLRRCAWPASLPPAAAC